MGGWRFSKEEAQDPTVTVKSAIGLQQGAPRQVRSISISGTGRNAGVALSTGPFAVAILAQSWICQEVDTGVLNATYELRRHAMDTYRYCSIGPGGRVDVAREF